MITKEEFEKAVEYCTSDTTVCTGCPLCASARDHVCGVYLTEYIKENEPAPSANGTSSEVSLGDTKKILAHLDDSTLLDICQEALLSIGDRVAESNGDSYILGYVHAVIDVLEQMKGENTKCQ